MLKLYNLTNLLVTKEYVLILILTKQNVSDSSQQDAIL